MENQFNLIDEPWIKIPSVGMAGLKDIFEHSEYSSVGGNPREKIAVIKLLLAISQAAVTPADEDEWTSLGSSQLAEKCLAYLHQWHDRFYLYGEKPFLQMPAITTARKQPYGALLPEVSTGNATILVESQMEKKLNDAEKVMLLLCDMGFSLGGKKTDNSIVLTPGYQGKTSDKGKPSSAPPGPSSAFAGLLHSFCFADNIRDSLWLNLLTYENIAGWKLFKEGIGTAPWEKMPEGEDCPTAQKLKKTLMGRLIPLSRFCLLSSDGVHYTEGIKHPNYLDGFYDPTIAIDIKGKKPKVLWVNPDKRPWRELTSLLSFIKKDGKFDNMQLNVAFKRAKKRRDIFKIWSGGFKLSSNAGEQYASGNDDYVESEVMLQPGSTGEEWFARLESEMVELDQISRRLYGGVSGYYKEQHTDGKNYATQAFNAFWHLCEQNFQELINACEEGIENKSHLDNLRRTFADYAGDVFDRYCPKLTARQMELWVKCRPNFHKLFTKENK